MDIQTFVARWSGQEGGAERANYALFLTELCDVLGVEHPEPAQATSSENDYVFERAVQPRSYEPTTALRRIDLYKRGSFILEAKQSRLPGRRKAAAADTGQYQLFGFEEGPPANSFATPGWDALMANARRQAEEYVFRLPSEHEAPPFLIVCDVGRVFEIYSDFSGSGRNYTQFPDRQGFRVRLEDLRQPETLDRLRRIWDDPRSLDPTVKSAVVTQGIAQRLAAVSQVLEKHHAPHDVAIFLMRCIFTMFAEDVELLPKNSFTALLEQCLDDPAAFAPLVTDLWAKMDAPEPARRFFSGLRVYLRHFNGWLFHDAVAIELRREQIRELLGAAKARWAEVEPAIFGTMLEQAIDPGERSRLGAHYTPRAYVERLVTSTVMEPLLSDWQRVQSQAEQAHDDGDNARAIEIVRQFLRKLCAVRVLDPACGTGNFLYVALELMKRLEGDVIDVLVRLGGDEPHEGDTIDPHQFLGIETNPRAAAIAQLVLWIGYLQQHYRTYSTHPSEPILQAFNNIQEADALLTWPADEPEPLEQLWRGRAVPRRSAWPQAEFIVGNPPFIGNKRMRERLGSEYVDALRETYARVGDSVDLVMYWWARAADLLSDPEDALRRFGYVTTSSITQTFNRRVLERYIGDGKPLCLVLAVPNHPWEKSGKGEGAKAAAVRIAMTVAERGDAEGLVMTVDEVKGLDTDRPAISYSEKRGMIAADLSVGAAAFNTVPLRANAEIAHQGVILVGEGFRLTRQEVIGFGYDPDNLPSVIKKYLIGRDLVQQMEERYIIDFYGMTVAQARHQYPALWEVILTRVKPQRDQVRRKKTREEYWLYGEPRSRMRAALAGLPRYIATCRTARHRLFSFLSDEFLPADKIIAIATDDPFHLGVLSSRIHTLWAERTGGWLGVGNDSNYNHSECFAKFPFPEPEEDIRRDIRHAAEELERFRNRLRTIAPELTLTGLYNLAEKVKRGELLTEVEQVLAAQAAPRTLLQMHEQLDELTAAAYGLQGATDEQILDHLVELNISRAAAERVGNVCWVRPAFQLSAVAGVVALDRGKVPADAIAPAQALLPLFPADREAQPLAVLDELAKVGLPLDAPALARRFRGGARLEPRVRAVLHTLARYGHVSEVGGRFLARAA
jgi:SAM-dependent methyltransferase